MRNRAIPVVVLGALLLGWCSPTHASETSDTPVKINEKKEAWVGLRSTRSNQLSGVLDLKRNPPTPHAQSLTVESSNATATGTQRSALTKAATSYQILTFAQLNNRLINLGKSYPNLIKVTTAQTKYNLKAAGGYQNYIATIQDYSVHPLGSASSNRLPEVLLSGALHGDERVGPTTVVETATLLVQAAACEAQPTDTCKTNLQNMGIKDANRQWLARLVTTRRIVIVPTANALGYVKNVRQEGSVDPNRDFAFDQAPGSCMNSIAARTMNELFREHQFQLSLTYHGGDEVISYEWGNTEYAGTPSVSPDDYAQKQIAAAYSNFGGSFTGSAKYKYGISNNILYDVRGGMEDWAYAGSWHPTLKVQCTSSTYGGYAKEKTQYASGMLRAFNILIEISNDKTPAQSMLGGKENVLNPTATSGNGYVSRTIRTSLLAIDLVEPYVMIEQVNGASLERDLVPRRPRNGRSCLTNSTKVVKVGSSSALTVKFTVGGGLVVDDTQIWYGKWSDIPLVSLDCIKQPNQTDVTKYLKAGTMVGTKFGSGRFGNSAGGGTPLAATLFQATLNLSGYKSGDKIVVLAAAKVDSKWGVSDPDATPILAPQSHVVRARTKASYVSRNGQKIIQGRLYWYSDPLTLNIS